MPKDGNDIRSYFKFLENSKKKSDDKTRRPCVRPSIISDDEDEVPRSEQNKKPKKEAEKPEDRKEEREKRKGEVKGQRKRIISSDEDEKEAMVERLKRKKARLAKQSSEEKLREVSVTEMFMSKPVKRVNMPSMLRRQSNVPLLVSKPKVEFDDDDDQFDETLNQLDTSKIEDEYLSTLNEEKSPFFKDEGKKKDKESPKKREGGKTEVQDTSANGKDKSDKSPKKNKSPEKNKSKSVRDTDKAKDHEKDKKHENEKKKKGHPHPNLEVEKESKPHKVAPKEKDDDIDYNDIIEEKIDKKKQHRIQYQNYLNRGGARNPGSKEIPEGAPNCFANMTFLITGVLDSLERQEAEGIIKQYGGKIVSTVSKKLNYMIVGDQAGPSKMSKAEGIGIKMIGEDDFLDLLRTSPGQKGNDTADNLNKRKRDTSVDKTSPTVKKNKHESPVKDKHKSPKKEEIQENPISPKKNKIEKVKLEDNTEKEKIQEKEKESKPQIKIEKVEPQKSKDEIKSTPPKSVDKSETSSGASISEVSNKLSVNHMTALVEKYRPKDIKQIIGQNGDKSNAKKLHFWLKNWHNNHGKKDKPKIKPKFNQRDDTGIIYKAALLSGPPGIGKTTTAYVVCADLGFEVIEFNASDTRSKKLLQEEIASILKNKTVKSFLNATEVKNTPPKHVLLMDEVDGMAGNEDRGGMQELISFIKATEIPIICICNDRQCQKIKTLANYTFDLRFQKPRLEQIRAAMMSICFKEGIKIKPDEITRIIQSTNQDIRQVLNHVAILSVKSESGNESKGIGDLKNVRLGPWEVIRKVFSAEEHKNMSIHDKSDLFFFDYNFAPLWVEENYLTVNPSGPRDQIYEKLAKCSESLAIGDIVEKSIRSGQNWSLLPVQAIFSSVIPGSTMSGFSTGQPNWPSWLGKNSSANKCNRLLQEITAHARIVTGASKEAINLDYVKMLVNSIIRPLAVEGSEGVDKAVEIMNKYHLSREDLDSLLEVTKWPHTRDLMQAVDTKTKAAFTRAYNKSASFNTAGTIKKKKSGKGDDEFLDDEDEELDSDNEDEDKVENDKLIKAKTSKAPAKSSKAPAESSSKSGRGRKPSSKNAKKK